MKNRDFRILKQDDSGLGSTDRYIPGMESVIATTSGYRGREKVKLIELIIKTGARYTGSLTKNNTHVVCWEFQGDRFKMARNFRLTIVNHRWFEECLQAGRHLSESPYIMCCGREVGPLSWEPPVLAEVTRQKRPMADDGAFVTSDASTPVLYRESPLKMHGNCFKSPKVAARSSNNNNEENNRPISTRRDNQVHHKQPLQDLTSKLYNQKAEIDDRNCSSLKQNTEKQRRKTRRLVKKTDYGSILNYLTPFEDDTGEPIGTHNVLEDKENSDFKNLGIVPEPGHGVSSPKVGIEVIYCASTKGRKYSIKGQTYESTVDMDIDMEHVGKPSSPSPSSDHNFSNAVACPICLTEASESRGILPCGHRFCLECIIKWAKIVVSQKKKPRCPVCKETFEYIFKNHADCNDQKTYSQTLPEFTDNNIYIVGDNGLEDNLQLPGNLYCNICGSGDTEELLLKCHRCARRAAHTFCLDPPLPPVSDVPWTCALCISGRRLVYEFP